MAAGLAKGRSPEVGVAAVVAAGAAAGGPAAADVAGGGAGAGGAGAAAAGAADFGAAGDAMALVPSSLKSANWATSSAFSTMMHNSLPNQQQKYLRKSKQTGFLALIVVNLSKHYNSI